LLTVPAQPTQPTQICAVANAEGIIEDADVTNVAITCTTTDAHLVRVVTQGLVGSVTLQNNGGDNLVVSGASATFVTPVAAGSNYLVTVAVQPPNQVCSVSNGSGTIAATDVTVNLTCVTQEVEPLGGIVTGLAAPGLVLANGADRLAVDEDVIFEMPTGVAVGAAYNLTVFTQPPGQICTVINGQGIMIDGGPQDVEVECVAAGNGPFPVTVTVSGLEADSVVINAVSDRTIAANGSFSYDVAKGANYAVTVKRNPRSPQQTCTVVNGSGVVNAPVAVQVDCVTNCAQLVINEVQVAGTSGNDEFIELYNKGTCAIDFNDYRVVYRSGTNGIGFTTVVANRSIPAGGYLVFGTNIYAGVKDLTMNGGMAGDKGQLGIVRFGTNEVIDGVGWGPVDANGTFREGATAPVPAASKSIARVPNGKDTHVNSADFVVGTISPKAANPAN
ncbi:MAG: lamin tail domain-containing protein, partial [Proteobacteria bacterium]